jgi:SEC-C motif
MTIEAVEQYLRSVANRPLTPTPEQVADALRSLKTAAVGRGDEQEAKRLWCLERALKAQDLYLDAFQALKRKQFYDAWCALERAEVVLGFLERHETARRKIFRLDFIAEYVEKWQSLFPYKVFFSPEYLEVKKECSICGELVLPRKGCNHRLGEIYGGEMCCHVVTDLEVFGIGMVENPVQKYSVPFLKDEATGKQRDHYNYAAVEYAIAGLQNPFDHWRVERTTRLQPHSRFRYVGRNEPCPCESKKKYKKCCLNREGVLRPHLQFHWSVPPPPGMPSEVYIP